MWLGFCERYSPLAYLLPWVAVNTLLLPRFRRGRKAALFAIFVPVVLYHERTRLRSGMLREPDS